MKNKGLSLGLIILIIVALVGLSLSRTYNNLTMMDEDVKTRWGQIEIQLKRRADLIPNLLETVKGYASHEKEIMKNIADARSGYAAANTPEEYARADQEFTQAVRSLNIMVENYPDLKANQNFQDFQTELAGTENRIATERMYYNESVQAFNKTVRRFPTNMIAGMFGYEAKQYFEVSEADKEVPKVEF